uniref:GH18 domain-containing protein n=1 Tax=Acrobeloides nanus TaxID=290746 RepID=A0A914DZX3_9BILA
MHTFLMNSLIIFWAFTNFCSAIFLSCYSVPYDPDVSKIDANLCTHILVIGVCDLDDGGLIVLPQSELIQKYNRLKAQNPSLKVLITLIPSNHRVMSKLVLNDKLINEFINTLTLYLVANNLDGFDIDWEFPVWSRHAKKTDKKGFAVLLQKLRQRFDEEKRPLLLTLAVSAPYSITRLGYDVDALNRYVDYVQVMNYDFHDFRKLEPVVGFNAPLRAEPYEFGVLAKMNSDYSTRYWLKIGLNRTKLIFGIPTYGRGFRLLSKHLHFPYAPAIGPSSLGDSVKYFEACNLTQSDDYHYVWNKAAASPYLYKDHQWITIEDIRSVTVKTAYAKEMGLGGVMVFAFHADDYHGICGEERFPLIRAIKRELLKTNLSV